MNTKNTKEELRADIRERMGDSTADEMAKVIKNALSIEGGISAIDLDTMEKISMLALQKELSKDDPKNNQFLKAALRASKIGPVFPVKPNDKTPLLPTSWKEVATTDIEEITKLWTNYPDANVGLHCENLVVVDVDVDKEKGKDGFDSLMEQEILLTDTYIVNTPRGGQHYYYKYDGGVSNSPLIKGAVDIRSNGGYVLAAGSVINGTPYKAINRNRISEPPLKVKNLCTQPKPKTNTSEAPTELDDAGIEIERQRAKEWLLSHGPAVEGQGGDMHTFNAAAQMRDLGLPIDVALEVLMEWNEFCEPPWNDDELQAKVDNAYKYSHNVQGNKSIADYFESIEVDETLTTEQPTQQPKQKKLKFSDGFSFNDIDKEEIKSKESLINGWLELKTDAELVGETGAGKTFLAMNTGVCVASGQKWFGNRVKQGGVLHMGWEGNASIQKRLWAIEQENADINFNDIPYLYMPCDYRLVSDEVGYNTGELLIRHAFNTFYKKFAEYPILTFIDTYSMAIGADASNESLANQFTEQVGKWIERYNTTIVRIHHPPLGEKGRGRGSSAVRNAVDTVLIVERADKKQKISKVYADKQRDMDTSTDFHFQLKKVWLADNAYGDAVDTCVVAQCDAPSKHVENIGKDDRAMEVVSSLCNEAGDGWVSKKTVTDRWVFDGIDSRESSTTRTAISDRFKRLLRAKRIKIEGGQRSQMISLNFDYLDTDMFEGDGE